MSDLPQKSSEEIIVFVRMLLRGIIGDETKDVTIEGTAILREIIVIVRGPYAVRARLIGKNSSMLRALRTILQPYCRRYGYFFQLQIRSLENEIQADASSLPFSPQKIRSRYSQT